jgi:type IV secretory pathway VirB10-like protein
MARKKKLNEDQPQENINDSSDDTFGLPEIEYEPLKRDEEKSTPEPEPEVVEATPEPEQTTTYSSYTEQTTSTSEGEAPREEHIFQTEEERYVPYEEEESSSAWPKILGIIALLLLLGGGAYYFFGIYQPEQKALAEKERQEQLAKEAADKKAKDEEAERLRLAEEQRKADSLANAKPPIGTIETLSERTGRYYVIVASGIDGDLIMDYAKKLSPTGVSTKIIPPNGKIKFYRLAVAEGDTYASTQSTADELKGQYEGGAWVIKF